MTNAQEVFVLQLSRSSGRANKFLRARSVLSQDRKDVIAAALLWCWENRANYSLTVTLDQWFLGAVSNAYRSWRRGEMRDGTTEIVESMGSNDDPEYNVTLQDAVKTLAANMDEVDRAIVSLTLDGKSQREVREALHLGHSTIERRLAKMRDTLPESTHKNTILRRVVTPPTVSSDDASGEPAAIDKEIEALEFAPPSGKECPPCWRCKWFEGYMPGAHVPVRMKIHEAEVRDAVRDTEARKISIAKEVRDGIL